MPSEWLRERAGEILRYYSLGFTWREAALLAGIPPGTWGLGTLRQELKRRGEYWDALRSRAETAVLVSMSRGLRRRLEEAAGILGVKPEGLARLLIMALRVEGGEVYLDLGGVRVKLGLAPGGLQAAPVEPRRGVPRELEECGRALRRCQVALALRGEPLFVQALREHGLLTMAKRYHEEGDGEVLKYLRGDDSVVALEAYREEILSAPAAGEPPEPKPLTWII